MPKKSVKWGAGGRCPTCDGAGTVPADPPRTVNAETGEYGDPVKFEVLGTDGKFHEVDPPVGPRQQCSTCGGLGRRPE